MISEVLSCSEGQGVSLQIWWGKEVLFCYMVALLLLCFMLFDAWPVRTKWNNCNNFISGGLCMLVDISFISVCNGL
jgi:uncharacterized membrane protein YfhO